MNRSLGGLTTVATLDETTADETVEDGLIVLDELGGAVLDATELVLLDDGAPELDVLNGAPELDVLNGAPELTVLDGAPEVAVLDGTPELAVLDGAPELAVLDGAPELAVLDGAPELAELDGTPELAVLDGAPELVTLLVRSGVATEEALVDAALVLVITGVSELVSLLALIITFV